jgi:hypothetical protein
MPYLLDAYCAFWEQMTPASVDALDAVAAPDFAFKDPFNDLQGRDAVKAMLRHMFGKVKEPRFVVTGRAMNGQTAYLRWRFTTGNGFVIEGMSEVEFGPDGKAIRHVDHWDAAAQVYGKIPLLGGLLRLIGRFF